MHKNLGMTLALICLGVAIFFSGSTIKDIMSDSKHWRRDHVKGILR